MREKLCGRHPVVHLAAEYEILDRLDTEVCREVESVVLALVVTS